GVGDPLGQRRGLSGSGCRILLSGPWSECVRSRDPGYGERLLASSQSALSLGDPERLDLPRLRNAADIRFQDWGLTWLRSRSSTAARASRSSRSFTSRSTTVVPHCEQVSGSSGLGFGLDARKREPPHWGHWRVNFCSLIKPAPSLGPCACARRRTPPPRCPPCVSLKKDPKGTTQFSM